MHTLPIMYAVTIKHKKISVLVSDRDLHIVHPTNSDAWSWPVSICWSLYWIGARLRPIENVPYFLANVLEPSVVRCNPGPNGET